MRRLSLPLLLALTVAQPDILWPQTVGLGSVSFPNSGARRAQAPFLRGLALLHSFEYEEALDAFREAEALKDEFVSTEHLLMAISEVAGTKAGDLLRKEGISKAVILKVLAEIRGPHRVTDQDPEGKYQALKKYPRWIG